MKKESLWSLLTKPSSLPLWEKSQREKGIPFSYEKKRRLKALSLEDELLRFSSHASDSWFLRDAVRGTQVFGATGSGKTSGSGKKLRNSFLKKGLGGLVLCVKTDEAHDWEEALAKVGRKEDLIRIQAGASLGFNFLDWEQKRGAKTGGGLSQNIADFFLEVISVIDRGNSSEAEGGFWARSLRELLNHTVVIASHLSETLTLPHILNVIDLAPQKPRLLDQGSSLSPYGESVEAHPFDSICEQARMRCGEAKRAELENSIHYFNLRFAALAEKTRSIIVTSFTSMADPLLRDPLLGLFCEETRVRPEDTFDGKVVVVDLPVHSFQMTGRIANLVWKAAFKRACQQRVSPQVPVFLWCDESQYLVDPTDGEFQTTARSSLCCTVLLTQTISNLYAEFKDRSKVEALMSCLHTKIFHQNDDFETNSFASKTIQKLPVTVRSKSSPQNLFDLSTNRTTVTESIQWEEGVPGRAFLNLKSGGPENRFCVEGIILYGGKKFSNGKPWLKALFHQKEN